MRVLRRDGSRLVVTATRLARCATLGAAAGASLGLLDAAVRGAVPGPTALVTGIVFAAVVGAATSAIRDPRVVALVTAVPPAAFAASAFDDVVVRALEIFPAVRPAVAPIVAASSGAALATLTFRLLRARRSGLAVVVAVAAGLATVLATLAPLEERAPLAARAFAFVVLGALAAGVLVARRPWSRGVAAVATAALATVVPFSYPVVRAALALAASGLLLSALRGVAARWVEAGVGASGRAVAVAVASAAVASVASERMATRAATAWDAGGAQGLGGAVAWTLRRLGDLDDDGYAAVFGPADCAPTDATRSPGRHETSGDDADENCDGAASKEQPGAWLRARDALHPAPPPHHGDVILITVDALRHDDASDPSLPALASLAARALVYDRAYSTSTMTAQAVPGIIGAELPTWFSFSFPRAFVAVPDRPTRGLGAVLAEGGFETAFAGGFDNPDNPIFTPRGDLVGFRQVALQEADASPLEVARAAERTFSMLDAGEPRLLWIHFMALHNHAFDRETYRASLREVDAAIGHVVAAIGRDAIVAVTSDHGEAFGEHGTTHHASSLYEEVAHVPLLLAIPAGPTGHVPTVTSLRSLTPTLAAMVRPELAPPGRGPYLCLDPRSCTDMPAPMALELPALHLHGLVLGCRHVIRDVARGAAVAFDVCADPEELRPLAPVPTDLVAALAEWEEHGFGTSEAAGRWAGMAPP